MTRHGRVSPVRAVVAALGAACATVGVRRGMDVLSPGTDPRWTRVNHRGAAISLLEGPAVAAGLLAGVAVGLRGRPAAGCAVAAAAGAAFGLVDDLSEDTERRRKGLRGHLGALRHGELTTGGLKVLGIGAASVVAAALLTPARAAADGGVRRFVDVMASGALIASSANLVNLLDLRPGRALKASALGALPLLASTGGRGAGAAVAGAALAAVGPDLAERDMLGDGGANALGALLGAGAVVAAPRPLRWALLTSTVALTAASERVSFTEVIGRTPVLREIDAWGRR